MTGRHGRLRIALTIAIAAASMALPAGAHAWDPAGPLIAPGVTVGNVPVGELDSATAARTVLAAYQKPVVILRIGDKVFRRPAGRLGQKLELSPAIAQAMAVGRNGTPPPAAVDIALTVKAPLATTMKWVQKVAPLVDRPAVNARYRLRKGRPRPIAGSPGRRVTQRRLARFVVKQLKKPFAQRSIRLRPGFLQAVQPKVTVRSLPRVVVIDRGAHTLTLYSPLKVIRKFRIATGSSSYPTPLGNFHIVTMQRHPWWYPPDADWAEGAEPVPPGPGNPLGTRWMGLSASGVGIHGTPNAASIGYSASHGCIRMRIPDAERLFRMVRVGTPVHIIA